MALGGQADCGFERSLPVSATSTDFRNRAEAPEAGQVFLPIAIWAWCRLYPPRMVWQGADGAAKRHGGRVQLRGHCPRHLLVLWTVAVMAGALLPAVALPKGAQAHVAAPVGLYGGTIEGLAVAPGGDVVLAATRHGLFRSSDRGESWDPAAAEWGRKAANDVAFHPTDPNVAFATLGYGLYRSATGGLTWLPVDLGVDAAANDIHISPVAPEKMMIRGRRAVATSDDGGLTWTTVRIDGDYGILSGAMSPSGETLLVCSVARGLERSVDGGQTWAHLAGNPSNCSDFAWDPSDPRVVWSEEASWLRRSTDGGLTWRTVTSPFTNNRAFVVPNDGGSSFITAGHDTHVGLVGRTRDGGQTWTVGRMEGWLTAVAVDPSDTQTVFAGASEAGIRKSTDGGATFRAVNTGLTAQPAMAIATDPRDAGTVYAALGDAGTFRSKDAGASWTAIHGGMRSSRSDPLATASAEELAVDAAGSVFSAGFLDWAWGVTRSADGGETWAEPAQVAEGVYPSALVAHPTIPDVILAGSWGVDANVDRGSVYRTTDGGVRWAAVGPYGVGVIDLVRHRGTKIVHALISVNYKTQLWRSDDFGITWRRVDGAQWDMWNRAVATGETADVVYVGGSRVRRSDDGGQTWVDITGRLSGLEVTSLAVDPADPTQVVAGTSRSGLWISYDRGANWLPALLGARQGTIEAIAFPVAANPDDDTAYPDQPVLIGTNRWAAAGMWEVRLAPSNRRRPTLSGKAAVGRDLTASSGRWSRANNYRFQWYRAGERVEGATSRSYTLRRSDRGKRVQCRVTARGPGGVKRRSTTALFVP